MSASEAKYTIGGDCVDGSAREIVFPSLAAALGGLLQHTTAGFPDHPRFLWVMERRPATGARTGFRPKYFHVNARATGGGSDGGDGTEQSPWWGLPIAIEQLDSPRPRRQADPARRRVAMVGSSRSLHGYLDRTPQEAERVDRAASSSWPPPPCSSFPWPPYSATCWSRPGRCSRYRSLWRIPRTT